jgi:isopentenyl-diphosphate Delta-isomerase
VTLPKKPAGPHVDADVTGDGAEERVVLVDDDGNAVGTAPKATVHHEATPLHLAFSCYVFSDGGRLLLTRRALHKPTWPGVWTNSFCGHPGPGEDVYASVHRRAEQELGTRVEALQLTLPTFRYDATMANGVMENELCPVFTATATDEVRADPAEVVEAVWVDWASFRDEVLAGRRDVSPWSVLQVRALAEAELAPGVFRAASPADLPPAARPAGTETTR